MEKCDHSISHSNTICIMNDGGSVQCGKCGIFYHICKYLNKKIDKNDINWHTPLECYKYKN